MHQEGEEEGNEDLDSDDNAGEEHNFFDPYRQIDGSQMNQILRQQQCQAAPQYLQNQFSYPYQNQTSSRSSLESRHGAAGHGGGAWHNEYQSGFPLEPSQRQQYFSGVPSESEELQNSLSLRVFKGEGRTMAE